MTDDDRTGSFRGARFTRADLTGATFRDCDLRKVKVVDSWLVDVNISGLVRNHHGDSEDVRSVIHDLHLECTLAHDQ